MHTECLNMRKEGSISRESVEVRILHFNLAVLGAIRVTFASRVGEVELSKELATYLTI